MCSSWEGCDPSPPTSSCLIFSQGLQATLLGPVLEDALTWKGLGLGVGEQQAVVSRKEERGCHVLNSEMLCFQIEAVSGARKENESILSDREGGSLLQRACFVFCMH